MFKTLLLWICLWAVLGSSGSADEYEIRGHSPQLDVNLSSALLQWREETLRPIREGNYTNIILHGPSGNRQLALTFDDSPDENVTAQVLDILKSYNIKAAFFMIAAPMEEDNETLTKRADEEGHLVLNHTYTHARLTSLSPTEIAKELHAASGKISTITGRYPVLMRPPYGSINPLVVESINTQGFTTVLWSLDSLDWAIKDKDEITRVVTETAQDGDIILLHSGRSNHATALALPQIIDFLRAKGYRFVRLDEMLGVRPYR